MAVSNTQLICKCINCSKSPAASTTTLTLWGSERTIASTSIKSIVFSKVHPVANSFEQYVATRTESLQEMGSPRVLLLALGQLHV